MPNNCKNKSEKIINFLKNSSWSMKAFLKKFNKIKNILNYILA